jgi:glycosyltransferase involved in cell wall biosynthesis
MKIATKANQLESFYLESKPSSKRSQSRKSHKIVMIGPSLRQQGGMATVENLILKQSFENFKIEHISSHAEGFVLLKLYIFLRAIILLVYKILFQDIDVIHSQLAEKGSVWRNVIFVLIATCFRKPSVIHAHGCEFHVFYRQLPSFLRHVVSYVFRQSCYFVALSESWRTFYIQECGLHPKQVVVLMNPIELPEKVPERNSHCPVRILFLGRLGKRKGVFDLLQAFAALPPECIAQSELVLAGDGEIEQTQSMVQALNLGERVKLVGWVNTDQKKCLLAEAAFLTLPSYNEGLPMAILEAMSWGLPVIATNVGGIPEVIDNGHNGLLIEPGAVKALTEGLELLIRDRAKRQRMGYVARKRAMQFDMQGYVNHLSHIYQAALYSNPTSIVNGSPGIPVESVRTRA